MKNESSNLTVNILEVLKHPCISFKRSIHPMLLKQLIAMRDFDLKFINEKPEIEGPVLYLLSHQTVHDAPVTCEILQSHFYILRAKQKLSFINKVFFALNGDIKLDRDSKKSGKKCSKKIVKILPSVDVVMYPGATWCEKMSDRTHWGWFDIAKKSGATVLPIVLEYYELTDNCCYVNYGTPFKIKETDNKEIENRRLEDAFATLKSEVWYQFPLQERNKLPRNLDRATLTYRYHELGTTIDAMRSERKYVIDYEYDPDYVFGSKEFQIGLKKLEKIKDK